MPIETGNAIFTGDPYKATDQGIRGPNGRIYVRQLAVAKLTDTLQINIPLNIIAFNKPNILQGKYPPKPLVIPIGGQICRVDFRLPLATGLGGETIQYGIYLPKGVTIIGTTGENLKVSPTTTTTHTVTSPAITAANSAYTAGTGVVLSRPDGVADAGSPSLLTTVSGADLALQLTVSNAGNTAAGNGIGLSQTGAEAYVYVQTIHSIAGNAVNQINELFPARLDTY
jgi:hypothetical protein